MNTLLKASLAASALSVALALAAPASAAAPGGADRAGGGHALRYHDLDTSKEADMRALYGRIRAAALNVCRAADSAHLGPSFRYREKCVTAAVDSAVARVGSATLAAIHNETRSRLTAAK